MLTHSQHDRGAFFDAYVECALWSSHIGDDFAALHNAATGEDWTGDTGMDSFGFGIEDFDATARVSMAKDCESFLDTYGHELTDIGPGQAGHDFWLTRNRHGAGFWDRGLGEVGERLTDAAHGYGECDLYVGDDERIYVA